MFAEKCYLMVESDPQTFEDATNDPRWKTAMKEEFSSLQKNNQSTIQICNDPVQKQRTKHIEIHMHYIKQLVNDGTIHLLFCASSEHVADIFTNFFCEKNLTNLK